MVSPLQDGINSLFWMAQRRLSPNGCVLEEIHLNSAFGQIYLVSLPPDFKLIKLNLIMDYYSFHFMDTSLSISLFFLYGWVYGRQSFVSLYLGHPFCVYPDCLYDYFQNLCDYSQVIGIPITRNTSYMSKSWQDMLLFCHAVPGIRIPFN